MATSTPISTLERITREVVFAQETDAKRYVAEQAKDGFWPATPAPAGGIIPRSSSDGQETTTTYQVLIEKQTYNGKATPAYQPGDRVLARPSEWAGSR